MQALVLALLLASDPASGDPGGDPPPGAGAASVSRLDVVPRDVTATVTDVAASGIYLDVGRDAGVEPGARGVLERDGARKVDVEVRHVSATSSFAVLLGADPTFAPQVGDRVVLHGVTPSEAATTRAPADPSRAGRQDPFTPLLAPPPMQAESQAGPIVHGSLTATTSWLSDGQNDRDFLYSRVFTRGAVERLFQGPWSLTWGLDLSNRSGDGYDGDSKQDEWRMRADELVLRRHFEDGSMVGLGRIQALALPGLGRIDGMHGEKVVSESWRIGAIAGLRPDPDDLGFTAREPVVAGYSLYQNAPDSAVRVTAAAGLLASWFEGGADQQAALADLFVRTSGGHWLRASTQLDLYSGEPTRSGIGITRLHAAGNLHLSEVFDVRGTWSQYQIPDTESERRLAPDDRLYGRGTRRAGVALIETFRGSGLAFEQEAAQLAGSGTEADWQFTARARQSRLFGFERLSGDLAVFNLVGLETDGLGGALGLSFFPTATSYVRLGYDVSSAEVDEGDSFVSNVVSLRASIDLGASLSLWIGAAQAFGDELDTTSADLGLSWRF